MEEGEKQHIKENLAKLVMYTDVSSELLDFLESVLVLNPTDVSKLASISNRLSKVQHFYGILVTRHGAYGKLLEALSYTKQSRPFQILDSFVTISYDKSDVIGKGALCATKVYRGTFRSEAVAVKVINSDFFDLERAQKEVRFLANLPSHPYIVRYFGTQAVDNEFLVVAMELCDMNLEAWLRTHKPGQPSRLNVLHQVTKGVAYLHSEKVNLVHRDLRPGNIFVSITGSGQNWQVKLSDMGLCKRIMDTSQYSIHNGSGLDAKGWVAPEILMGLTQEKRGKNCKFSRKTDVFALGLVHYFVLTNGNHPFGRPLERELNIVRNSLVIAEEDLRTIGPLFVRIKSMLSHEPLSRPSADEMLKTAVWMSRSDEKAPSKITEEQPRSPGNVTLYDCIQWNNSLCSSPVIV